MNLTLIANFKIASSSRIIIILSFFIAVNKLQAQTISAGINASSIAAGSRSTNVDFSTGIMNYNIPLFNLEQGAQQFNVGLAYTGKGIKVEQSATVVGLGWSLRASGVITRSLRGIDDENEGSGSLYKSVPSDPLLLAEYNKKVNKGEIDGESDLFNLTFNDLNISFILERIPNSYSYKAVPLTKTNVKIEVQQLLPGGLATSSIMGFKVTDENGDQYIFSESEMLLTYFKQESTGAQTLLNDKPNAWHLSEIISYNGEKISFEYQDDFLSENRLTSGSQMKLYGKRWVEYGKSDSIRLLIQETMENIQAEEETVINMHKTLNYLSELINNLEKQMDQIDESTVRTIWDKNTQTYNTYLDPYLGGEIMKNSLSSSINTLISEFQILKNSYHSYPLLNAFNQQLEMLLQSYWTTPVYSNAIEYPVLNITGTKVKLLKKIKLRNSEVSFNYKHVFENSQAVVYLNEINSYNSSQEIIKRVVLEHSGQTNSNSKSYLKSIKIKGAESEDNPEIYGFEYFNESDYIGKYNQDFWGFPNGGGSFQNNSGLLPIEWKWANNSFYHPTETYKWMEEIFDSPITHLPSGAYAWEMTPGFTGSSRAPSATHAITRSLKKITLPGGGDIQFNYELNTINARFEEHSYGAPASTQKILTVGGLRIKSIIESDGAGNSYTKRYKYEFSPSVGSTLVSSGFNVKQDKQSFSLNVSYTSGIENDIILSSSPYDFSFQVEETGNENIFYSYVEEEAEGIGKTGYNFLQFNANVNDLYPFWLERILLAKTTYNESGKLTSLVRYKYQVPLADLSPYISPAYLNDRFEHTNQFQYNVLKKQFKRFPYSGYDENIGMEFPMTSEIVYYSPYYQYYQVNIDPRINVANPPTVYNIAIGGRVLLKEKESFLFPSVGAGAGFSPLSSTGETLYNFNWLFGTNFSQYSKSKQIFYYDNPEHTLMTRVEREESEGTKTLTKIKYSADYLNTASTFISGLKTSNVWNAKIEQQNWIYSNNESQWKFINGQLNLYAPIVLDPNPNPAVSRFLNFKSYSSQLDHPISPGTNGWNEAPISLPPYSVINHENNQIYLDHSVTYHWTTHSWGIRLEGQSKQNDLSKSSVVNDIVNGHPSLKVNGVSRDNIGLLDFDKTGNGEQYNAIKKPISEFGVGFGSNLYDNLGYIQNIAHNIKQIDKTYYGNLFEYPVFRAVDSLVIYLANPREYPKFTELSLSLWSAVQTASSADLDWIALQCAPYNINFEYLLQNLLNFSAAGENNITTLFRNRNYIVTSNGTKDVSIALDYYKSQNKRIKLTSLSPFSIQYKVNYSDGSPSIVKTVSNSVLQNNYHVGYISPTDIINYTNGNNLMFSYGYLPNSPASIWITPEDSEYEYSKYEGDKILLTLDQTGIRQNYYYDDMSRLKCITDREGHIIKSYIYHYKQ